VAVVGYAGGVDAYGLASERYLSWRFDQGARAPKVVEEVEALEAGVLREGEPLGRLEVPRIGISVMVLQGAEEATLISGAGHVPGTPSPGVEGNVVIAAHRDTFFRKLGGVRAGDRIRIVTTAQTYDYVVDSTEVVDPEDTRVMESRARAELTLITCYPFHFIGAAPQRFVVHARPLE
jgi:sortase A